MYNTRRAAYLAAMMDTGDKRRSCKLAGLGPHAPARIRKLIKETGGIEDRPRSGRPTVYTHAVLAKCYDVLLKEEPLCKWNTTTFFQHLKSKGLLHENAKGRCFFKKLVEWGRGRNLKIQLGATREEFGLLAADEIKRVEFAKSLLEEFNKEPRMRAIFIDEICLEFGAHPKSGNRRSCVHARTRGLSMLNYTRGATQINTYLAHPCKSIWEHTL